MTMRLVVGENTNWVLTSSPPLWIETQSRWRAKINIPVPAAYLSGRQSAYEKHHFCAGK
jgi:hypothetical protein